ncbi:hypothetical protein H072_4206 [Dactylellina haptotyla CBS 200.50]|uniref:Uncharacterized protein n=1 Tax=Dactylellina haptotyla (strain CBS 200.50) TaxID=1284197 RepID=S8BQV2_DACHA|nr:hypothetical protein H072_4206 [Dactylellina haptotyla CBS 200.50]
MAERGGESGEGTQAEVFDRIARFFHQYRNEEVQIEYLPFYPVPDTHIYIESTSIGIPKSSLWKAFQHARVNFFSTLQSLSQANLAASSLTLLSTSLVLILHDPEHITALNTRKRLLLSLFPPQAPFPQGPSRGQDMPLTPQTEYTLLTSILTSPLHRHTKSPHLWSHRRWLLTTYPSLKYPPSTSSSSSSSSSRPSISSSSSSKLLKRWARNEISTILRAAESHPKNYYAWTYARHLVLANHITFNHEDLIAWCTRHPADVSGWSFLAWLWVLERDHFFASTLLVHQGRRRQDVLPERYNQLLSVLRYSHNTSPGHESLWGFVKAVVTQGVFDGSVYNQQILEILQGWDGKEWPVRVADDIVRERLIIRQFLTDLYAKIAATGAAAAAAATSRRRVVGEDTEMTDQPP